MTKYIILDKAEVELLNDDNPLKLKIEGGSYVLCTRAFYEYQMKNPDFTPNYFGEVEENKE